MFWPLPGVRRGPAALSRVCSVDGRMVKGASQGVAEGSRRIHGVDLTSLGPGQLVRRRSWCQRLRGGREGVLMDPLIDPGEYAALAYCTYLNQASLGLIPRTSLE